MNRIVLPLDGSEQADRAVPLAVALARKTGAELTLVQGATMVYAEGADPMLLQQAAEETLAAAASQLAREHGVKASTKAEFGFPPDVILRAADEEHASFIVMSTHGRTGLMRAVLGSVAETVLRNARIPVILVPPQADTSKVVFDRLLVPLDGSDVSYSVMGPVEDLARTFGTHLILFRGFAEPQDARMAEDGRTVLASIDQLMETAQAEAQDYVDLTAHRLQAAGIACEARVGMGDPAELIPTAATELGADGIAMATHGRSGLDRLRHGSVAEAVLRHSPVPVLTFGPAALKRLASGVGATVDQRLAHPSRS